MDDQNTNPDPSAMPMDNPVTPPAPAEPVMPPADPVAPAPDPMAAPEAPVDPNAQQM